MLIKDHEIPSNATPLPPHLEFGDGTFAGEIIKIGPPIKNEEGVIEREFLWKVSRQCIQIYHKEFDKVKPGDLIKRLFPSVNIIPISMNPANPKFLITCDYNYNDTLLTKDKENIIRENINLQQRNAMLEIENAILIEKMRMKTVDIQEAIEDAVDMVDSLGRQRAQTLEESEEERRMKKLQNG